VYDILFTARKGVWAISKGHLHGVGLRISVLLFSRIVPHDEGRNAPQGCYGREIASECIEIIN
jgi:hypothetical protein